MGKKIPDGQGSPDCIPFLPVTKKDRHQRFPEELVDLPVESPDTSFGPGKEPVQDGESLSRSDSR